MGSYYATAAGEAPASAAPSPSTTARASPATPSPSTSSAGWVALSISRSTPSAACSPRAGQAPTGSSDPLRPASRRLGVLAILEETGLPISLVETIDGLLIIYREAGLQFDNAEVRREIIDFHHSRRKVARCATA